MREFKGTQGEWEYIEDKLSNGYTTVKLKETDHDVCTCFTGVNRPDFDELIANAKLIAAAPELLEALVEVEKHHQGYHSEIGNLIRNAISKALD